MRRADYIDGRKLAQVFEPLGFNAQDFGEKIGMTAGAVRNLKGKPIVRLGHDKIRRTAELVGVPFEEMRRRLRADQAPPDESPADRRERLAREAAESVAGRIEALVRGILAGTANAGAAREDLVEALTEALSPRPAIRPPTPRPPPTPELTAQQMEDVRRGLETKTPTPAAAGPNGKKGKGP